jgi:hypothetical protein
MDFRLRKCLMDNSSRQNELFLFGHLFVVNYTPKCIFATRALRTFGVSNFKYGQKVHCMWKLCFPLSSVIHLISLFEVRILSHVNNISMKRHILRYSFMADSVAYIYMLSSGLNFLENGSISMTTYLPTWADYLIRRLVHSWIMVSTLVNGWVLTALAGVCLKALVYVHGIQSFTVASVS